MCPSLPEMYSGDPHNLEDQTGRQEQRSWSLTLYTPSRDLTPPLKNSCTNFTPRIWALNIFYSGPTTASGMITMNCVRVWSIGILVGPFS